MHVTWKCVDCYNQYYFTVLFLQVLVSLMSLFPIFMALDNILFLENIVDAIYSSDHLMTDTVVSYQNSPPAATENTNVQ